MKQLLISGFEGRMGRETARLAPACGFAVQPFSAGKAGDVVIDFSHPDCLHALLQSALPLVIGTTGYSREQLQWIRTGAQTRPIFLSSNFSAGVAVLDALAQKARQMLPDWDISLIERHHAGKLDAPSGTAIKMAETLNLAPAAVLSVRAGTLRGAHEIGFYGQEEHILLTHTAESRAVFALGALKAAAWLIGQPPGLYGMNDLFSAQ